MLSLVVKEARVGTMILLEVILYCHRSPKVQVVIAIYRKWPKDMQKAKLSQRTHDMESSCKSVISNWQEMNSLTASFPSKLERDPSMQEAGKSVSQQQEPNT